MPEHQNNSAQCRAEQQKGTSVKDKLITKLLALLLALAAGSLPAWAVLDETSGTNAVTSLAGNVQNAGNTMLPIMLAIILIMSVIGVYYRFAGKAKVRT